MSETDTNQITLRFLIGTLEESRADVACAEEGWRFLRWHDPMSSTQQEACQLSIEADGPVKPQVLNRVLRRIGITNYWDVRGQFIEYTVDNEIDRAMEDLEDSDPQTRFAAVRRLGDVADPRAVAALVRLMDNEEETSIRTGALVSLKELGPVASTAVPQLFEHFKKCDENDRSFVLAALERIATPEAKEFVDRHGSAK